MCLLLVRVVHKWERSCCWVAGRAEERRCDGLLGGRIVGLVAVIVELVVVSESV